MLQESNSLQQGPSFGVWPVLPLLHSRSLTAPQQITTADPRAPWLAPALFFDDTLGRTGHQPPDYNLFSMMWIVFWQDKLKILEFLLMVLLGSKEYFGWAVQDWNYVTLVLNNYQRQMVAPKQVQLVDP